MAHTFERAALYEEVWSTPLSTLGPKYGLSDNGLRKICKAMSIPLPQAGHWAKVAAGHHVRRTALAENAERTSFVSYPPDAREHVDPGDQVWLKSQLALEDQPANLITVDLEPARWHRAIEPLQKKLETAIHKRLKTVQERDRATAARAKQLRPSPNFDHFKYAWLSDGLLGEPLPACFRVSEQTGTRALAIANAIFLAAEKRGCIVAITSGSLSLKLKGTTFLMSIREQQDFDIVDSVPAYPTYGKEKRRKATDRLALVVSRSPLGDFKLTERDGHRLEGQVNNLFCRLYRSAVLARERTKEILAEHERRLASEARAEVLAQERRAEAATRAAEAARRDALATEAARWQQAQQIRQYVEATVTTNASVSAALEWRAWAIGVADSIDPMINRLKSFESKT